MYHDNKLLPAVLAVAVGMIAGCGTLKDADGNVYKTVQIGTQVWMAENLRTTKFNDGTPIPKVEDADAWTKLTTPGYCYYENAIDQDSIMRYGALYNWYAVATRKLAPKGWHVPTNEDWKNLENYLCKSKYSWDTTKGLWAIVKSLATKTGWIASSYTGSIGKSMKKNNSTGFSALPGGWRRCSCPKFGPNEGRQYCTDDFFEDKFYQGYWWSATERDSVMAGFYSLIYNRDYLFIMVTEKCFGCSVRLVRD